KGAAGAAPFSSTIDPNGPFDNEGLVKDAIRPLARTVLAPNPEPAPDPLVEQRPPLSDFPAQTFSIEVPSMGPSEPDFHVPLSTFHGLALNRAPRTVLPALDHAALLREDQIDPPPAKMLRFGRQRSLAVTLQSGAWYTLADGGWLWATEVVS